METETPAIASPVLRAWVASSREDLNARFQSAAREHPRLEGEAVLSLCAELLPPLAKEEGAGTAELLSSVYDLILLHAGRGTLAPGGGTSRGVTTLLRKVFPSLKTILLTRPESLPSEISNAVENLDDRGEALALRLPSLSSRLESGENFVAAMALCAWRLGNSRLREEVLEVAERLPAASRLEALDVGGWPSEAASLVTAALRADAWRRPEDAISAETLAKLAKASPRKLEDLRKELSSPPRAPLAEWASAGIIGGFAGFDGHFEEPPLLLDGPETSRHRFWALASNGAFRLDADVYGWSCRPDDAAADYKVGEPKTRGFIASLLGAGDDGAPRLAKDGTLTFGGESAKFEEMAGATSFVAREDFVAWTVADSHRIRIRVARAAAV